MGGNLCLRDIIKNNAVDLNTGKMATENNSLRDSQEIY